MKIITFVIAIIFLANSYAQEHYHSVYKTNLITTKNQYSNSANSASVLIENIIYNINSDNTVCYIDKVEILQTEGVNSTVNGDENLYINTVNNSASYNLKNPKLLKFKDLKFQKTNSTEYILGYKTTKYISKNKKVAIYLSNQLPWFIQPCLFSKNILNGAIFKIENYSTNVALTLAKFEKIKNNLSFNDNKSNILKILKPTANEVTNPFCK